MLHYYSHFDYGLRGSPAGWNDGTEMDEQEHPVTQERVLYWGKNGAALVVLTAAATTAWISMGWPVPATTTYVVERMTPAFERIAGLEEKHNSLTVIVLRQKQSFLVEEIQGLEAERETGGGGRHLDSLISIKEGEVRAIQKKIESIEAVPDNEG